VFVDSYMILVIVCDEEWSHKAADSIDESAVSSNDPALATQVSPVLKDRIPRAPYTPLSHPLRELLEELQSRLQAGLLELDGAIERDAANEKRNVMTGRRGSGDQTSGNCLLPHEYCSNAFYGVL